MARRVATREPQAPPYLAVRAEKVRDEPTIRAAGGVVIRTQRRGVLRRTEVALVHRPRYGDWSFPKGKQDRGDDGDEATALREVEEETGLRCVLGKELTETRYRDAKGRHKLVRYWLMGLPAGVTGEGFVANREVDELRWCTMAEAARLLTYEHDRVLLEHLRNRRR